MNTSVTSDADPTKLASPTEIVARAHAGTYNPAIDEASIRSVHRVSEVLQHPMFRGMDLRPAIEPIVNSTPKIKPNEPCPCGSGKKFKKCCEGKQASHA